RTRCGRDRARRRTLRTARPRPGRDPARGGPTRPPPSRRGGHARASRADLAPEHRGEPMNALPHRGRAVLFGVAIPVLVTVAAWTVALTWLDRLPAQIALHWGPDGIDRVGPPSGLLTPMAVMSGVTIVVLGTLALTVGRTSFIRRLVLALASGLAVFFAGLTLSLLGIQLDRTVAVGASLPSPDAWLALTAAVAVVVAVVAGTAAGRDPAQAALGPVHG